MVELLVLADDFTGALDTGVQFAGRSIPTLVSTRIEDLYQEIRGGIPVLVLDLETRHLPPGEAAARVRLAVEGALSLGVRRFYKKTDSTLRGNIGSELEALLESAGEPLLPFVPAYPATGRTTVAGRHYVNGVPLHRSPYGGDPQDPVRTSSIPDIIGAQSRLPVVMIEHPRAAAPLLVGPAVLSGEAAARRIAVFDARCEEDLKLIARELQRRGLLWVSAGSAGFAAHLPEVLSFPRGALETPRCPQRLLVLCGSTDPVSLEQVDTALGEGAQRILLEPEQVLRRRRRKGAGGGDASSEISLLEPLRDGNDLILQAASGKGDIHRFLRYAESIGLQAAEVPRRVARGLAELAVNILRSHGGFTPVVFGGDTALAFVEALGFAAVLPVEQISAGVVLSRMSGDDLELPLISKAGGFGEAGILRRIRRRLG
jgi:uncharacterized protein YgbK (DUF1537 family)